MIEGGETLCVHAYMHAYIIMIRVSTCLLNMYFCVLVSVRVFVSVWAIFIMTKVVIYFRFWTKST